MPHQTISKYRFVLTDDSWGDILQIFRRGTRKPVATIEADGDADYLAAQFLELFATMPGLRGECKLLLAEITADLESDDLAVRFQAAKEYDLRYGLRKAIDSAKR